MLVRTRLIELYLQALTLAVDQRARADERVQLAPERREQLRGECNRIHLLNRRPLWERDYDAGGEQRDR